MKPAQKPRALRWLAFVAAAWLGTLLLRAIPVGGDWDPVPFSVWMIILLWVGAYAFGYAFALHLGAQSKVPSAAALAPVKWRERWIAILCVMAILGAALITVEFAVIRGYGFTTPVALIRAAEVESASAGLSSGSLVSGVGRLLTPALQIAWILTMLRWKDIGAGSKRMLFFATAVVFWQQAMYEGGRFFLAALVVSCFVARSIMAGAAGARSGRETNRLLTWRSITVAGIVMVFFGLVFLDRATSLELEFSTAYSLYTESFDITVGPELQARLDGPLGALWFAAAMFWIYVTQGVNELAVLLRQPDFVHAFGFYQFPQLGQALTKLTGVQFGYDIFVHLWNVGTYNTAVGGSYVDFGVAGATAFALLLGAVTALATRNMAAGQVGPVSLSAPLLITIGVFSPVISLVTNLWPAMVWAFVVGCTAERGYRIRAQERTAWRLA